MTEYQKYVSDLSQKLIFILLVALMICIPVSHYLILALGNYFNAIQNCIYTISVLLVLVLLFGVLQGGLKFNNKFIPILTLIMIFIAVMSTVTSIEVSTSVWGTGGRYEGLLMILSYYTIFLSASLITDESKRKKLLYIFLFIGIIHCLYGVCQRFDILDGIVIDKYNNSTSGVAGNPNFMGTYTVLLCGLASAFFYFSKSVKNRIFYLVCLLLFLLTMILTDAMSALFGTSIMIIVFFVYLIITWKQYENYKEKFSSFKLLIVGVIIGLVGIIALITLTNNNYLEQIQVMFADLKDLLSGGEVTVESGARRFLVWKEAISLTPKYWLFGSGLDTFGEAYHGVFPVREEYFNKAHNEYIQILITQGVPALICYFTLYFYVIKNTIRKFKEMYMKKTTVNDYIYIGLFIAVIGYIFQAIFNISVIDVAPFFWMFLGLLTSWFMSDSKDFIL